MIDPNEPAFPQQDCRDCGSQHKPVGHTMPGLTIRAHFAAMAMQGMMADPESGPDDETGCERHGGRAYATPAYYDHMAKACLSMADALIAALNATQPPRTDAGDRTTAQSTGG